VKVLYLSQNPLYVKLYCTSACRFRLLDFRGSAKEHKHEVGIEVGAFFELLKNKDSMILQIRLGIRLDIESSIRLGQFGSTSSFSFLRSFHLK
jgi:hypothetical protein